MSWYEETDEHEISKLVVFSSRTMNRYAVDPAAKMITLTFSNLDSVSGPLTATPMFIVYDGNCAEMMAAAGDSWTIKE